MEKEISVKTLDLRYALSNIKLKDKIFVDIPCIQQKSISNLGNVKWNYIECKPNN